MHTRDVLQFDTPQAQRDQMREALRSALARESDVAFAFIHGSFLTEHPFHDIDIAVYLVGLDASQMSLRTPALAASLETTVFRDAGIRPHPPFDMRPLNPAPLGFCYQVLRHGRLLPCPSALLHIPLHPTGIPSPLTPRRGCVTMTLHCGQERR